METTGDGYPERARRLAPLVEAHAVEAPEVRTMLFPVAAATMPDVWHVMGLRATGSDSYSVSDLFVPHTHSEARDEPAERRQPGLLYCFPTGSMYASGFAGVALGIARSMLDALVALAQEKTPRGHEMAPHPPSARRRPGEAVAPLVTRPAS